MRGALLQISFLVCAMQIALAQAPEGSAAEQPREHRLPVDQMLSSEPISPAARTGVATEGEKPRKTPVRDPAPLARPNTDRTLPVERLTVAPPPERPLAIRSTLRQVDPVNKDAEGVAMKGFDPVSYHAGKQPLKGREDIVAEWQHATWHFVSEEHRQMFLSGPERYAPQYGGYCSYGMSRGAALPIDPARWAITNDKLYLFHDTNLESLWGKDSAELVRQADLSWPRIRRTEPKLAPER